MLCELYLPAATPGFQRRFWMGTLRHNYVSRCFFLVAMWSRTCVGRRQGTFSLRAYLFNSLVVASFFVVRFFDATLACQKRLAYVAVPVLSIAFVQVILKGANQRIRQSVAHTFDKQTADELKGYSFPRTTQHFIREIARKILPIEWLCPRWL